MEVNLGNELIRDLNQMAAMMRRWSKEGRAKYLRAHRRIGQKWRAGAVKRVPVDSSFLKQRVVNNTYESQDDIVTECGSNVPYAPFLEFGTEYIAGGEVKARFGEPAGYPVDVKDSEALHTWPAKSGDATGKTSASMDIAGGAAGRMRNSLGQFVKGRAQEQLPFLRPAFSVMRDWAIKELAAAYEPPKGP